MTSKTVRALAAAFLIGTAAAATATFVDTTPAMAAAIKTPAVAKLMKEASAAAKAGNFRLALQKAQQAEAAGPKGAEVAVVTQFIAYAATQAGAYSVALTAYDRMIASGAVNRTEGLRTALRLALKANQPARALQYANQLGGADAGLVAQIQFQQGNYREVIRLLSPQMNSGTPSRDSLVLLQNSYYRLHDEAGTQRVLESLALHYPSADSWHDIINLTRAKAGATDRGLLEVYRMRSAVGDLKDHTGYFEAAEVSLAQRLPNEAKALIDKAVAARLFAGDRDQRLINLVNTRLAGDQAAMAQVRAAADANPHDGNDDIRLAEMLWTYGKHAEAEQLARKGIKEGGLRDPDIAQIVLGHILLSQGKRGEATQAFNAVSKTGKLAMVGRLWSLLARAGVSTTTQ